MKVNKTHSLSKPTLQHLTAREISVCKLQVITYWIHYLFISALESMITSSYSVTSCKYSCLFVFNSWCYPGGILGSRQFIYYLLQTKLTFIKNVIKIFGKREHNWTYKSRFTNLTMNRLKMQIKCAGELFIVYMELMLDMY